MYIATKIPKILVLLQISFLILPFLIKPQPMAACLKQKNSEGIAPLSPSMALTAKTDKEVYLLRQKITIEGNVTENGSPASDLLVLIQAENPRGTRIAYRTLTIGNPTQTWPINITNLFLMDGANNLINTAKIGTQIQVGMTLYNWQLTSREVYATITVYDANMVPLQAGVWGGTIDVHGTISPRFSIYIDTWTCSGKALICGNVYSDQPKTWGIALCPEKTAYFCISRTQQGLLEYPELPPPQQQTSPGHFTTDMRVSPDPLAGEYTLYLSTQNNSIITASTTATFNIQDSTGYPPQASFAFWPAAPYVNQTVNFDASSSTGEGFNDSIVQYKWDFGDGTAKQTRTVPTITHAYQNSQTNIVTLNVTDKEGLWSTTSKPITILPEFGPKANFTYTPVRPIANRIMTFNASNSKTGWSKKLGGYSPIISYKWNFSDGTIISTSNPIATHNYTQPGNYTVKLTITDSVGRTDTVSTLVRVVEAPAFPWDINGDGIVDISDILDVALHYGTTPESPRWDPRCDVNNDGIVDISDILDEALHYGETAP
jgi:PKD repeat protein